MNPWDSQLFAVLEAAGEGRSEEARAAMEALSRMQAPHRFDALLARALARLSRDAVDPYVDEAGFRAFIRGGGNVPLYRRLSAELGERLRPVAPVALLDIGAGDGLVYQPLPASLFARVDLVEPSAMLASAEQLLREKRIPARGHAAGIQEFLARSPEGSWDAALASFSLQALPAPQRAGVLEELRRRGVRLFLAEFDTPAAALGGAEERFAHMIERYRRGLDEYAEEAELVADGFLVPIFLSASWQDRVSFEQPLAGWLAEVERAGFSALAPCPLHAYWWADAFLLEAVAR